MTETIVIPFGYDGDIKVTPICLVTHDRDGNRINPSLWRDGVAPLHALLCKLAIRYLGDVTRVTDLAQAALERAWEQERRGDPSASLSPRARIGRAARLIARSWCYQAAQVAQRFVSLDPANLPSVSCTSPEQDYVKHLDEEAFIDRMRAAMAEDERDILDLYLFGLNTQDIADAVGGKRQTIQSMLRARARAASRSRP